MTGVKNQGACGSCWAFSLTSQVESYNFLATGDLVELSTQQVTSCTPNTLQCGGTGGCRGSVTQLGFNYLQLFGAVADSDWPYVSGSTGQNLHVNCHVLIMMMMMMMMMIMIIMMITNDNITIR